MSKREAPNLNLHDDFSHKSTRIRVNRISDAISTRISFCYRCSATSFISATDIILNQQSPTNNDNKEIQFSIAVPIKAATTNPDIIIQDMILFINERQETLKNIISQHYHKANPKLPTFILSKKKTHGL